MRSFPLRRDLGLQLLALYGLFVGLIFVAVLVFAELAERRLEADVRAADLALALAIAQETNANLENALNGVRQLSSYPAIINADNDEMLRLFSTVMRVRSDINLVYRLDADGTMLFHYPLGPESTVGVDFSFRDYFQRALTGFSPLMSQGRISPTTAQPVATAVMPIRRNGIFLGVVGTNLRLQTLSDSLRNIVRKFATDEALQVLIVDASGQIIAHSDPALLVMAGTQQTPQAVAAVLNGETGHQIGSDDGDERLYSYVPIGSVGWGVLVSRPTAVAFATPRTFRRGAYIVVAIFLLAGTIFWRTLSRRVIQPLERLAAFSQDISAATDPAVSHQTFLAPLTDRPDQMGNLSRSLTTMQQAIEARLQELSTLLDTSTAVVSSLDSSVVLDRILEQVERLHHTSMCAIFAVDQQQGMLRVQSSRGLSQWYTEHAIIDPSEPTSVTMRALRSGEPVQISDTETNPSFTAHRERARRAGYRSVLAVPLNTQHTPPSALLVFRPDVHEFTQQETNLLVTFANQAAMAIENAALFARSDMALQQQTGRLEALIQSMQDGIVLEDLDGRVLYANRRIHDLCARSGVQVAPLSGQMVAELMQAMTAQAQAQDEVLGLIETAVAGSEDRRVEFAIKPAPNQTEYWRLRVFDVTDRAGQPIGRGRLLQDITQRRELDRMKSSLISTVSHELRTPLAAIKGYASTLLADDVEWDEASQRDFLQIISNETDHLSQLVSDLLDMSRIEAGNLRVSKLPCDLPALVEQAAAHAHPSPGSRLHVDLPPHLPIFMADPQRIEVVLRNLIENAARYSGADTPVYVRAVQQNGSLLVSVADDGPGISVRDGERIFDSFYRGDGGMTRQTTGAGLGLAISRGFIRAHGGDIWLEPQQTGTCITFSLPLAETDS